MQIHHLSELFPEMQEDEYLALKSDIQTQGLLESIVTYEGQIIDGRHRYRACEELGIEPRFEQYTGENPVKYVVSKNAHRRHLNSSQRAVIAVEIEKELAKLAKTRMTSGLNQYSSPTQKIAEGDKGEAREQAAKLMQTNRQYVSSAKKLETEAPALHSMVKKGGLNMPDAVELSKQTPEKVQRIIQTAAEKNIPIAKAAKEIKREEVRQERVERVIELAEVAPKLEAVNTRYPIIYADPPWKYEFAETENRAIENHYPTMTLDEICALPISDLAAPDAVLFLWATSPKLPEAMKVIESWGFNYVTCAVWVKNKIGMGYYFRQRHELLFVAKRGDIPVPEPAARRDSVLQFPSSVHSAKPHEIYGIIEAMYPEYNKIELFARNTREGWAGWGNQYAESA